MAYYIGDIPAEDIVIEPARNGEPIDLTPFDTAEVTLRDFDGAEVETSGFVVTIDAALGVVVLEWPAESVFADPGLYSLNVALETVALGGPRERLAPVYLVAQDDDGWHTLDTAREEWADAPSTDLKLYGLLWAAKAEVIAFAPALAEDARPPMNYRQGQIMQARNLWNAATVDPANGGLGEDSFVIRPYPLDWMIRQVLRPKTALAVSG